jgi:hypothetical protein
MRTSDAMTDPVKNPASLISWLSGDICRKAHNVANPKNTATPRLQGRCTPETSKLIGLNSNVCQTKVLSEPNRPSKIEHLIRAT